MNQFYKPLYFNKCKLPSINVSLDLKGSNYFNLLKKIEMIFGEPSYELSAENDKIEGWFLTNKIEELIIEFTLTNGSIKVYCNEKNKVTTSFLTWLEKNKSFIINTN